MRHERRRKQAATDILQRALERYESGSDIVSAMMAPDEPVAWKMAVQRLILEIPTHVGLVRLPDIPPAIMRETLKRAIERS